MEVPNLYLFWAAWIYSVAVLLHIEIGQGVEMFWVSSATNSAL